MDVVNIVATGNLNTKVKLKELNEILEDKFDFNPKKYHCGYLKLESRKISIFESGKYIMLGLKDIEEIEFLYSKMKKELNDIVDFSEAKTPSISNMVVQDEIEDSLDLNKLAIYLGLENVAYEPEEFPGLTYRKDITFNIYPNGKVIAFGENLRNIKEELTNLKLELKSF